MPRSSASPKSSAGSPWWPPPSKPTRTPAAMQRPAMTSSTARSTSLAQRVEDHRGAVGDDLAHRLPDLGGVEAHHHDRVRLHEGRILHHAVDRVAARFLEELRVLGDLAADQRAQSRHDVAGEAAAAHDDAEDLALDLTHAVPGDVFGSDDQHDDLLLPGNAVYRHRRGAAPPPSEHDLDQQPQALVIATMSESTTKAPSRGSPPRTSPITASPATSAGSVASW